MVSNEWEFGSRRRDEFGNPRAIAFGATGFTEIGPRIVIAPLKDGAGIARLITRPAQPEVEVDDELTFTVAVAETEIALFGTGILEEIFEHIRTKVVPEVMSCF